MSGKGDGAKRLLVEIGRRGLVVLEGGPADPRWYFADDLEAIAGRDLGWSYRATTDCVAHPTLPSVTGVVHRRVAGTIPGPRSEDPTRCTRRGCERPPTRRLQQSIGGRPWFGCDEHWPAMSSALAEGMPGATSGGSWVQVDTLTPATRPTGEDRRDAGIERAVSASPAEHDQAVRIIEATARRVDEFSANAVRDALDAAGIPRTVNAGAFRSAVAAGYIAPTDRLEKSEDPGTNAHRITVYRSRLRAVA